MPNDPKGATRLSRLEKAVARALPVAQGFLMATAATLALLIVIQLEIDSWSGPAGDGLRAVLLTPPR